MRNDAFVMYRKKKLVEMRASAPEIFAVRSSYTLIALGPRSLPASIQGSLHTICVSRVVSVWVLSETSVGVRTTYLPLGVGPEIHDLPHQVVQGRVGALVHEHRRQAGERPQYQPDLDAPVHRGAGEAEDVEGPLVAERDEAEQQVERLEDGDGLHGAVEVVGEEVEEDLGPDESFYAGGYLIWESRQVWGCFVKFGWRGFSRTDCCRHDDEPRPVVLD